MALPATPATHMVQASGEDEKNSMLIESQTTGKRSSQLVGAVNAVATSTAAS